MLLLDDEGNDLNDNTPAIPRVESEKEKEANDERRKNGTMVEDTGVFSHMSMTQRGSEKGGDAHKEYIKKGMPDPDIKKTVDKKEKVANLNPNVTNRDLNAVVLNPKLKGSLETIYNANKSKKEAEISQMMADKIIKFLMKEADE